ncbi:MAG: ATP-binding protein [Nitrospirales bacterium]
MLSSLLVDSDSQVMTACSEFGLLDHVPVGTCILSPLLTILHWNRLLEEWSGLSSEVMLNSTLGEHFPHFQLQSFTSRFQDIVDGGPPTIFSSQLHPHFIPCELRGGQRQVQYTTAKGVQIPGVDGICVLLVIQDVTTLSLRIQEYREARDQALQEVEERTRIEVTLLEQSRELERSNQELVQFAAIASHDLQEPLRKVMTFGDRLQKKCVGQLDDTGRDYLERMQNATRRMQRLITDMLSYSRVTTKAQPFESVDLRQVVRDVVSDLESRIEATKGRVEIAELPTIEAEPFQMRQLLQNLIGNALKYSKKDVPPIVKVSAQIAKDGNHNEHNVKHWRIEVADTGVGFDEQYVDRIFGMFQRLHGKAEYEGTGVGLAICKKIVERHAGMITANSVPGQGSIFIVTMPERRRSTKAKA